MPEDPCADQAKAVADANAEYNRLKAQSDKLAKAHDKSKAKMNRDCARSRFEGKKGKKLDQAIATCSSSSSAEGSAYNEWDHAQSQTNNADFNLKDAEKQYSDCRHENPEAPD